ncbi:MAG: hypothetical protein WC314_12955 [Vulcanimicrobiota bacterium]
MLTNVNYFSQASNLLDQLDAEIEKIRLRIRIDRGIQQAERGETVPHEEIENMIDEWLNE